MWTVYAYRAPTPAESEAGDYAATCHPDHFRPVTLREVVELINNMAPASCGVVGIESCTYPVSVGDWVTVTYEDGAQFNIFRHTYCRKGLERPPVTAASVKRLIRVLSKEL